MCDIRRVVHWSLILGVVQWISKQKAFVLKTVLIHGNCKCEGVSETSGNGA